MSVENRYVDADLIAGKLGNAAFVGGAESQVLVFNFEVAVADDDGSIFRIARSLNPVLIPIDIKIFNDAITGGSDYDLGLYETIQDGVGGTVIAIDVFASALDMSAAAVITAPKNGLENLDIVNIQRRLYEHGGQNVNTKFAGYDIALTANTVGAAAGTISGIITFAQG